MKPASQQPNPSFQSDTVLKVARALGVRLSAHVV